MTDRDIHILNSFKNRKQDKIPFWFMRQAGRYLPEFREVRAKAGDFFALCYNPELASEVTIQPIRRFDMSAAIIFSDILVIPQALGTHVEFVKDEGPKLDAVTDEKGLAKLSIDRINKHLNPVYEAISLTRSLLEPEKALIGFSGSVWTLAAYMVDGESKKGFPLINKKMRENDKFLDNLFSILEEAIFIHLSNQIESGADMVQLFDSWCGIVEGENNFQKYVIDPTARICRKLKSIYPNTPIIGFPRNASLENYESYAKFAGTDGVGIDYSKNIKDVVEKIKPIKLIQGNLSPELLANDKEKMLEEANRICQEAAGERFIFNLGHGFLPHTPIENVEALCNFIKNYKS